MFQIFPICRDFFFKCQILVIYIQCILHMHHMLVAYWRILIKLIIIIIFIHTFQNVATSCQFILSLVFTHSMFRWAEKALVYQQIINILINL